MPQDPTQFIPKESQTLHTQALKDYFSVAMPDPVKFVEVIVNECVNLSASDILFEPRREQLNVRARIDGVLYELGNISLDVYDQITSRIKVLANLDPTERRKIQEGQFTIDLEGRTINLRVEIAQTIHGEVVVMRVH